MGELAPAERVTGAFEVRVRPPVAVCHAYFGSPAAAMLAEVLMASGVGRLLMLGEAGSLSPACRIGSLVLPTWGIREEGTSYHYLPPEADPFPDVMVLDALRRRLPPDSWREGGVWTVDAPFRETVDKVREYASRGAVCVEMECTALMAVTAYRKASFGAVLVITDELFGEEWAEGFTSEVVQRSRLLAAQALAAVLGEGA